MNRIEQLVYSLPLIPCDPCPGVLYMNSAVMCIENCKLSKVLREEATYRVVANSAAEYLQVPDIADDTILRNW